MFRSLLAACVMMILLLPFHLILHVMLHQNEILKELTMKRCSSPNYELVYPQLVLVLRKLHKKCFRGEVLLIDTFVCPGELKTS